MSPRRRRKTWWGKSPGNSTGTVACVVDAGTALKLQESQEVELSLPFATTEKISATIAAINQPDLEGDAAVILECRTMNSMLANIRQETVQVDIRSYSGVLVSQQAIHFETVEGNRYRRQRQRAHRDPRKCHGSLCAQRGPAPFCPGVL